MYYNTRTNEIIYNLPLNGYFENGSLVQGLDIAESSTIKLCGYLPIKSDTPSQPENSHEIISERIVQIEDDGVIITRTWEDNPPLIPEIPASISPRQIRLWLIDHNISLSNIDDAINNIEDIYLKEKTKVEWQYSPYIERQHPMISMLGQQLGLNSEQIDAAFIEAAQL